MTDIASFSFRSRSLAFFAQIRSKHSMSYRTDTGQMQQSFRSGTGNEPGCNSRYTPRILWGTSIE